MVTVIVIMSGFTVLSFVTRFYQLHLPAFVCWDEVHFGKMAGWHINRRFFFDVHPPAGKLMFAAVGYLSGYNGSEMYAKPGDAFNTSHYIAMRAVSATCGSLVVPVVGYTLFLITTSGRASAIAMLLLTLDHGCLTISRYIILDPILLFAVSLVFLLLTKSQIAEHRYRHFSRQWWSSYVQLGISLAFVMSVKFVGAFIVIFVGLMTSIDLWKSLRNPNCRWITFGKHFGARILTLIVLPLLLYSAIFMAHLYILKKSGIGDGKSSLQRNHLYNTAIPQPIQHSMMALASSAVVRLLTIHKSMLGINCVLRPKEGQRISRPWEWPLNYKGQLFCGDDHRVYLLGNPVIWWFCAAVILIFPVVYGVACVWRIRVAPLCRTVNLQCDIHILDKAWWFYVAWLMHYLPFYLMSRVLYYHHYYPAFIISVIVAAMLSHWLLSQLPIYLSDVLTGSAVAILCFSFVKFMPLSYGMSGPMADNLDSSYTSLKWLSSWEI